MQNNTNGDLWRDLGRLVLVCTEIRVEILCHLLNRPSRVDDIAASLELEGNLISYHLAALRRRRLVQFTQRATERVYSVTPMVQAIVKERRVILRLETGSGCAVSIEVPQGQAAFSSGAEPHPAVDLRRVRSMGLAVPAHHHERSPESR